jgi:hypothetical protein
MADISAKIEELVGYDDPHDCNTKEAEKLLSAHISSEFLNTMIKARHDSAAMYAIDYGFTSVQMNRSALLLAVQLSSNNVLASLLAKCDAGSMPRDTSLVELAAARNNIHGIDLLLQYPRLQPIAITNLLVNAAYGGEAELIERFMKWAASSRMQVDIGGALIASARRTHNKTIARLLAYPTIAYYDDNKYVDAMDWLIHYNRANDLKFMLTRYTGDIYLGRYDLLARAVRMRCAETIDVLLADARINPMHAAVIPTVTAAHAAVEWEHSAAIRILAKVSGAHLHQLLIKAINANNELVVQYIISRTEITVPVLCAALNQGGGVAKIILADPRANIEDVAVLKEFLPQPLYDLLALKHSREAELTRELAAARAQLEAVMVVLME